MNKAMAISAKLWMSGESPEKFLGNFSESPEKVMRK